MQHLAQLQKLFLANNKITRIDGVAGLQHLEMLELGSNRIRVCAPPLLRATRAVQVIENLDNLPALTQLYLGKNKIARIEVALHRSNHTHGRRTLDT